MDSCGYKLKENVKIVEEEHTLESFAEKLFSKPAQSPRSVLFDVYPTGDEKMDHLDVFKMLLIIFTIGAKIKFGDESGRVDITTVYDSIFTMKEYFRSISFDVHIDIQIEQDKVVLDIPESKKDTFEAHYYRLNHNDDSYFIRFSAY